MSSPEMVFSLFHPSTLFVYAIGVVALVHGLHDLSKFTYKNISFLRQSLEEYIPFLTRGDRDERLDTIEYRIDELCRVLEVLRTENRKPGGPVHTQGGEVPGRKPSTPRGASYQRVPPPPSIAVTPPSPEQTPHPPHQAVYGLLRTPSPVSLYGPDMPRSPLLSGMTWLAPVSESDGLSAPASPLYWQSSHLQSQPVNFQPYGYTAPHPSGFPAPQILTIPLPPDDMLSPRSTSITALVVPQGISPQHTGNMSVSIPWSQFSASNLDAHQGSPFQYAPYYVPYQMTPTGNHSSGYPTPPPSYWQQQASAGPMSVPVMPTPGLGTTYTQSTNSNQYSPSQYLHHTSSHFMPPMTSPSDSSTGSFGSALSTNVNLPSEPTSSAVNYHRFLGDGQESQTMSIEMAGLTTDGGASTSSNDGGEAFEVGSSRGRATSRAESGSGRAMRKRFRVLDPHDA